MVSTLPCHVQALVFVQLFWFDSLAVPLASLLMTNMENVMCLSTIMEALGDFVNLC